MKKIILLIAALTSLLLSFESFAYKEGITYKDPYDSPSYSSRVDFYGMQMKMVGDAQITKSVDMDIKYLKPTDFSFYESEEVDDNGNPTGVINKKIRKMVETSEGRKYVFYVANSWYHCPEDGKWYCTDKDGNIIKNTFSPDGYTVDATGAWIKDGVQVIEKYNGIEGTKLAYHEPGGVSIYSVRKAADKIISDWELKPEEIEGVLLYPYTDIRGGFNYIIYVETTQRFDPGCSVYSLDDNKLWWGLDDLIYYKYSWISEEESNEFYEKNAEIQEKVIETIVARREKKYIGPAIFFGPEYYR